MTMRIKFQRALIGAALLAVPISIGSQSVAVASPNGSGTAPQGRQALASVERAAVAPEGAKALGPLSPTETVEGDVVLAPRDNSALVAFINEVTDKSSSSFGRYLAGGSFADRFGPLPSTISKVRTALRADGLDVTGISSDGLFVGFKGSAQLVERAFHTGLESYRLPDGSRGSATTTAVRLPSSIARYVTAVVGLDDLVHPEAVSLLRAPRSAPGKVATPRTVKIVHPHGSPTACAAAKAAAVSDGGLTDDAIANSYGAFGLYGSGDLGAGQHVALYELEPFATSDVGTFDTCYFGAAAAKSMLSRLRVIPVDGGQPAGSGSGEAILDVDDISAMAPDAHIDVYEGPSPSTNGIDYDPVDGYVAIIDADQDQVVSSSWGLCEQSIEQGQPGLQQAENLLFEQAAAQGQSVFGAAGDNGSDDCNTGETSTPVAGQNPLSLDDPAGQPYVVSVGGTTIDAATEPPLEHIWNDGAYGGGGGGGISQSWTMPAWQRDATVPGIALPGSADYKNAAKVERSSGYPTNFCQSEVPGATSTTPCRLAPDVSAQADEFTGAITVYQAAFGGWQTTGGTSSATPIWASLTALTNASSTCASNPATSRGVGFVSPLLYSVASNPAEYKASFNDITAGNNDIYGLDDGLVYPATPGYDLASGLGSPRLTGPGGTAGLAYYLCQSARSPRRPVVSGLSPASGTTAGGEQVTITGTGFETGGKPAVATIEVGTAQLPPADFTVHSATSITAALPPASRPRPPDAPAPQDGAGGADVIVTLADGQTSAPGPQASFEYVDKSGSNSVPSITGVVPIGGRESAPSAVTLLGSGFSGASEVSFGGVAAKSFNVDSPYEITAVPPPYSSGTKCSPLPKTGVYAGENARNDICQVQVSVTNTHGSSALGQILPPFEGAVTVDSLGDLVAPPGCGCETAPVPTEYDYLPAPHLDSVSTSGGAADLASENGATVITVHGIGLNPMTIDWADVGPPGQGASMDISFVFVTGTSMQIVAPVQPLSVDPLALPLSVRTVAGQSLPIPLTYAGVPTVTEVVNRVNKTALNHVYGAPDTGGTPIEVKGKGFQRQLIAPIDFSDSKSRYSFGTQYNFGVVNNDEVTTETVAQNPALVDVQLCTVTACSLDRPADLLYLYPPGEPDVTSVTPATGPAAGGTKVQVRGVNLGCAIDVYFGSVKAPSVSKVHSFLDCGATTVVDAKSPAGRAGSVVSLTVMTVESYFSGTGRGRSTAKFTYKKG